MRLQVLAGLAAVATAVEQFEDDDVNFLRFLSSNMSVNASGTAAPTTTGAPNTTTGAPTTTASNGTTTGAPTTTGSSGNGTTTGSVTTTQGQQEETTTGGGGEQQSTQAPATTLCSAAAYQSAGLVAPATFLDTTTNDIIMISCSTGNFNVRGDASTQFYTQGERAGAADNVAKCASPATTTQMKCGTENTLAYFNGEDMHTKAAVVQKCCGASPSFSAPEVGAFKSDGTFTWTNYTDSQCATASTGDVVWPDSTLWSTNPGSKALGECFDSPLLQGHYGKFSSCNDTHYMGHRFYDSACTVFAGTWGGQLGQCDMRGSSSEQQGGNGSAPGVYYEKMTCTATAPATKQFSTTLQVDFAGLAGLTTTQLGAIKSTYETKAQTTFETALNNADATVTATHTYSGALATRRRLAAARRRLSGAGGVASVFVTQLPAAAADTAQAAIVTATTGAAALNPATFKSTIETELATNAATTAFASNITATVAAPVVTQTAAVPSSPGGGGGSTSGAVMNLVGMGSALVMAIAVMF